MHDVPNVTPFRPLAEIRAAIGSGSKTFGVGNVESFIIAANSDACRDTHRRGEDIPKPLPLCARPARRRR